MLFGKRELKKEEILPVCLYQKKKIRQSVIIQKNFARCGPKNFAQATKAGINIYNQEIWLEEPMEERECRVCEPLKDYDRVVARRGKRR